MIFQKSKLKFILLALAGIITAFIAVFLSIEAGNSAQAQVPPPSSGSNPKPLLGYRKFGTSDIEIKIDAFKPGNAFRVMETDDLADVTFNVSFTKPTDSLYLSSGNALPAIIGTLTPDLGFVSTEGYDLFYVDKIANTTKAIRGIGVEYVSTDPKSSCGAGTFASTAVRSCSYVGYEYAIKPDSGTTFPAYQTFTANKGYPLTLKLDKATRAKYGINKSSDTGERNTIYVTPFLGYSAYISDLLGTNDAAFVNGALPITLIVYKNSDAGKAAFAADKDKPIENVSDNSGSTSTAGNTGSTLVDLINNALAIIVMSMVRIIYWMFATVLAPLIEALLNIHPYQDVFVEAVYQGWQLIRNLCNIFFIIVLLVIGLGTLFQVESYNYKHLLVKVVIAALAVNFSLVAGQAILGIADTFQAQFMSDSGNVIRALGTQLMVRPINLITSELQGGYGAASSAGASFANTTKPIFALALALGAFFTFVAIAAFLVIRVIALWILLLVSPLAYVANILPMTAGYSKEWWQKFLRYAFMTPVLAFFLNLTAVFVTSQILNQEKIGQLLTLNNVDGSISQYVYIAGSQILTILFLLAGLKAAASSGTYAAAAITNVAEKATYSPFKAIAAGSKAGAERGFEGIQNKAGITLDPRIYAKEYKKYADEQRHKRLEERADKKLFGISSMPATGSARDMLETYANWHGFKRATIRSKLGLRGYGYNQKAAEEAKTKLDTAKEKARLRTDTNIAEEQTRITEALEKAQTKVENYKRLNMRKEEDLKNLKEQYSLSTDPVRKASLAKQIKQQEKELEEDKNSEKRPLKMAIAEQEQLEKDLAELQSDKEVQLKLRVKYDAHDDADLEKKAADARKELPGLEKAYNDLKDREGILKRPEAYAAIAARHHLVSDEMKKISSIEDSDILIQLYKDAVAQSDRFKAEAIVKQLAKDGNFNDLMSELYGGSSFENAIKFFKEDFKNGFNLSDHAVAEVASEVGYINEGNKIWNMARLTQVHDGHLSLIDPDDPKSRVNHDEAIRIQMEKVEPQTQARDFTRFAFIDEEVTNDTKNWPKGKKYTIHGPGAEIIKGLNTPANLKQVKDRMKKNVQDILLQALRNDNTGLREELGGEEGAFMQALQGKAV